MKQSDFPSGWDDDRAKRLVSHYESTSEEQLANDDDKAALEHSGNTVISVPEDLLPAIRQLMARQKSA